MINKRCDVVSVSVYDLVRILSLTDIGMFVFAQRFNTKFCVLKNIYSDPSYVNFTLWKQGYDKYKCMRILFFFFLSTAFTVKV